MLKRLLNSSGTAKVLGSVAVLGAASAVAGLGTFATFTSSTSASNGVASGTVAISLPGAGVSNRLSVGATGLVPGDTLQRAFDLSNTGSENLATLSMSTSASPSSLLDTDATYGLQMTIDKCTVAWTETGPPYGYTCGGTSSNVISSRAVVQSNLALPGLASLTAGGSADHLRLTLSFPATAGNTFQNLSSTILYSFTGTQRAAASK